MELMFVLAVIGIVGRLLVVNLQHHKESVMAQNIVDCVVIYETAIKMYYNTNNGTLPVSPATIPANYFPQDFFWRNFVKTDACSSITYSNSLENGCSITIILSADTLRPKIVEILSKRCVPQQIKEDDCQIIYYLKTATENYL